MKIVFHGGNAASFRDGIEAWLEAPHEILTLSDDLSQPGERESFVVADVVVGVRLGAADPVPARARLYHAPAAGTDAIDPARLPAGAALCNAFGHEHAIAEYVMAALLQRHVPLARADARLREGHWDYWAGRAGALRSELGGQSIGLLGYGHIGKAIATRARAFGMRVSVCNRSPVATGPLVDESHGLDALPRFMAGADAVIVSLPLTEATRGIVGREALAAMQPHGIVVNVGRGPVIDEAALFEALSARRIGGAVIDTWYRYPAAGDETPLPASLPFHTLDNVVMTPHMSGWTEGTVRRRQQTVADNVNRLARGDALTNLLRPAQP